MWHKLLLVEAVAEHGNDWDRVSEDVMSLCSAQAQIPRALQSGVSDDYNLYAIPDGCQAAFREVVLEFLKVQQKDYSDDNSDVVQQMAKSAASILLPKREKQLRTSLVVINSSLRDIEQKLSSFTSRPADAVTNGFDFVDETLQKVVDDVSFACLVPIGSHVQGEKESAEGEFEKRIKEWEEKEAKILSQAHRKVFPGRIRSPSSSYPVARALKDPDCLQHVDAIRKERHAAVQEQKKLRKEMMQKEMREIEKEKDGSQTKRSSDDAPSWKRFDSVTSPEEVDESGMDIEVLLEEEVEDEPQIHTKNGVDNESGIAERRTGEKDNGDNDDNDEDIDDQSYHEIDDEDDDEDDDGLLEYEDSMERDRDRVYEEDVEKTWEKGGSGLVFHTDERYWSTERCCGSGDASEYICDEVSHRLPSSSSSSLRLCSEQSGLKLRSFPSTSMVVDRSQKRRKTCQIDESDSRMISTPGLSGHDMMERMGWKGGGLGVDECGRKDPIIPTPWDNKRGIGH
eukprot:TRINITY_DN542_c0_g3_i2.p1 TRINITY_DN542_c0_g3~~TRINITY_DN542_c0_g3_i2.p1  ORF type:complete len:511 (-),score=171.17 TRINITY_DN542_c0_g3_i2:746-2278(-)